MAFGECTCTGVHGANRLASNSLLESVVFSSLGAKKAKNYLKNQIESFKRKKETVFANIETLELNYLKTELRKAMWNYVGIIRNERQMDLMLKKIKNLNTRLAAIGGNGVNTRFVELKNMVTIANLVTIAANAREESRGTHYRADYPNKDDKNWQKHIYLQQKENQLNLSFT